MPTSVTALILADSLPVCDTELESDLISLCDLVVTGIETDPSWHHWRIRLYDPDADGSFTHPWAILEPLKDAEAGTEPVSLTAIRVRQAVATYADGHLARGMSYEEVRHLVDGSYTDAVIADSILQIALYGKVIYS